MINQQFTEQSFSVRGVLLTDTLQEQTQICIDEQWC
jgi:hypothetical protein